MDWNMAAIFIVLVSLSGTQIIASIDRMDLIDQEPGTPRAKSQALSAEINKILGWSIVFALGLLAFGAAFKF